MRGVLLDSSVLLDVLLDDPVCGAWSSAALHAAAERAECYVDVVVYSEVSVGFERHDDLDGRLEQTAIRRAAIPYEAGFWGGKASVAYHRRGGTRTAPLPDFLIGTHAAVAGMTLLTRDPTRVRAPFPRPALRCPPGT